MRFTDIFIKRPVLASVISLLIFLFGLHSILTLPVEQFPKMDNTTVTISTGYPGANASLIQGFITTPIEQAVAQTEGLDYMTSSSTQGSSTIELFIKLNFDPNTAFTDAMAHTQSVMNQLPKQSQNPVITKSTGNPFAIMYIGFSSERMSSEEVTDYLTRVIQPKLQTISGVSQAQILGGFTFAMRVWLDLRKMAAFGVTSNDVYNALAQNNYQTGAGSTKGVFTAYNISAHTDMNNTDEFKNMIVKEKDNGQIVRLKDVAQVKLGAQNYDASVIFNGEEGVFVGMQPTPSANPLTIAADVRKMMPSLRKSFPPGLVMKVVYDSTRYISSSIHEVIATILEATVIVILVIFLFLGSLRSVIIPMVTIPLSLVGVCTLMLMLGYSLNLLTLLAMVLAIGMVVDDAIVVVENVHRHLEDGKTPFEAALIGAREIATPVIAMTITLAAVYAPIGFMGGLTGALFKQFAFTLAATVVLSGVIALTLSPMMCSKLLKHEDNKKGLSKYINHVFDKFKVRYHSLLSGALNYRPVTCLFAAVVLGSCYFLYANTQQELAPQEDQSAIFVMGQSPAYGNIDYVKRFTQQLQKMFESIPQTQDYFLINQPGQIMSGDILVPWDKRKQSEAQIIPVLQQKLSTLAGIQMSAFAPPALPGNSGGLPVQFEITSFGSYKTLANFATRVQQDAEKSGLFMFSQNTLQFNQPQLDLYIDRNQAAEFGLTMQSVGSALATNLGGNYINYFNMDGWSYQVIPQVLRNYRLNPQMLTQAYVRTATNQMIPLSTFVRIKQTVQPNALTRFQQLNSATIQGVPMPDVSLGTALNFLKNDAQKILPKEMSYNYAGQSRQFIQEGNALIFIFFFAIIVIFLVLAAQFESFRDPIVIMISVPMSICGALIPLNLGAATINIYTQIGLVTLIGLISKHGILMVEFANNLQETENLDKFQAIIQSASIRLRPILMTTLAMIFGVMPLVFASGAGAQSRYCIGLVIACGMFIGTMFTLFVVPTMYTFFAKDHRVSNLTDVN